MCRATMILLILIVSAMPAWADTITLKDGRVLEGHVQIQGDVAVIETRFGSIRIPAGDIVSIQHGETTDDLYEAQRATIDPANPSDLRALAAWCREHELLTRARALEAQALELDLAAALEGLEPDNARGHWALVLWAQREGLDEAIVEDLVARVLAIDPDHAEAHRYLGHVRWREGWYRASEVEALEAMMFSQEMRARGLVEYGGAWVAPEERLRLLALEAEYEHQQSMRQESLLRERAERQRAEAETALAQAQLQHAMQESAALQEAREAVRLLQAQLYRIQTDIEAVRCRCPN